MTAAARDDGNRGREWAGFTGTRTKRRAYYRMYVGYNGLDKGHPFCYDRVIVSADKRSCQKTEGLKMMALHNTETG